MRLHCLATAYFLTGRASEALNLAERAREPRELATNVGIRPRCSFCSVKSPRTVSLPRPPQRRAVSGSIELDPAARHAAARRWLTATWLKLYRRIGKREQAHEHLTTATTMYREMGMRFYLEKVVAEMASDRPIVGQTDGP